MRTDWLCLEFTRTVGWETRDRSDDRFASYDGLVDWARERDAISASTARVLKREAASRPRAAGHVLRRAVALRELVYGLFRAIGDGGQPNRADVDSLNRELETTLPRRRLRQERDGFVWEWRGEPTALDQMLDPVVWSAAELLTAPEWSRLKHCESDGCGYLFIDGSKNRSRRWCDMTDCGNLEKVRRFRRRRRRKNSSRAP